jgi:signal transduction histidine kinase
LQFGILVRTGEIEKGVTYLKEMRNLIGDDTTSLLMGEYYFNYANYYGEQHNDLKRLQYLQKCKKILLSHNQDVQTLNHNLMSVFEGLKDYENVLKIQKELRKKAQLQDAPIAELFSLFGIMSAQDGMKDYEAAKKTCHEAINLKNNKQVANAFGYVYYTLGYVHLKTAQLDSAELYFQEGIDISKAQNEAKELGDNYSGMAELYFKQGKLQEAKVYAEKARASINYIHTDNNTILAKIYVKEGDYQKAYELLNINWSDAQKREEERTDYQIISTLLKDKFEKEKRQEQLLLQQKFNKQRQFLIGGILITGLILLMSIVFIQTRNNKQLKQLNEQLYQQNNALQQFSYIASHDIKEPMRSIGNYVGLIRRRIAIKGDKDLDLYFNNIKSGLQQIYTLIEDVMQYTQVNKEGDTIGLEEVNLNLVVKNIEIGLEVFIHEKGAKVIYGDLPIIDSSSSMLFIILKNIIQNGLKFNESEVPTVEISYDKTKIHHEIIISDNGIGMEEKYHERIFEMFKRLHNKSTYQGSGIGLSIVKLSVEKLGGRVILTSEEGKGSRFVIELPI